MFKRLFLEFRFLEMFHETRYVVKLVNQLLDRQEKFLRRQIRKFSIKITSLAIYSAGAKRNDENGLMNNTVIRYVQIWPRFTLDTADTQDELTGISQSIRLMIVKQISIGYHMSSEVIVSIIIPQL